MTLELVEGEMNGPSEDILLKDEIERDEQNAEGGQEDALPLAEVIAGQDNGKEEEVKKREPVADEEGDGQDTEEDGAERSFIMPSITPELSDGHPASTEHISSNHEVNHVRQHRRGVHFRLTLSKPQA
jgi:hypothetical protein